MNVKPASHLKFDNIRFFNANEFPGGVLENLEAGLVLTLNAIRKRVPESASWTPSPLFSAHIRDDDSGSRHNIQGGERLADATDGFVTWPYLQHYFIELNRHPEIGGFGIYPDMTYGGKFRSRPMIHVDLRLERICWVATRDEPNDELEYTYLHAEPATYFAKLAEAFKR